MLSDVTYRAYIDGDPCDDVVALPGSHATLRAAAEAAGDHYYRARDYALPWPRTFEILDGLKVAGVFEVAIEYKPQFFASRVDDGEAAWNAHKKGVKA